MSPQCQTKYKVVSHAGVDNLREYKYNFSDKMGGYKISIYFISHLLSIWINEHLHYRIDFDEAIQTGSYQDKGTLDVKRSQSDLYIGQLQDGRRNGCGLNFGFDGSMYLGEWKDDMA